MNANQLYIGALNLSPYLTQADFDVPIRWKLDCWNVPESVCKGLFCNPVIKPPLFLRWKNDNNSRYGDYEGVPTSLVIADFLFLEYAPYTELNFMFESKAGRFGFHIKTRLYLALEQGQ